jgi:hypothetical protein
MPSADPQEDHAFVRTPDVLHSRSGAVTVALSVGTGDCFSFAGPSGRIWDLLETPHTPRGLARQLVREFEIEEDACLAEVLDYLGRLQDEGLVQRAEPG